jgi:hypothetical protein
MVHQQVVCRSPPVLWLVQGAKGPWPVISSSDQPLLGSMTQVPGIRKPNPKYPSQAGTHRGRGWRLVIVWGRWFQSRTCMKIEHVPLSGTATKCAIVTSTRRGCASIPLLDSAPLPLRCEVRVKCWHASSVPFESTGLDEKCGASNNAGEGKELCLTVDGSQAFEPTQLAMFQTSLICRVPAQHYRPLYSLYVACG